jgi:hypothetical protein
MNAKHKNKDGIDAVEKKIGEMEPGGGRAPDLVVDCEREEIEWDVVGAVRP